MIIFVILVCGCTMLAKYTEKKLKANHTRMLFDILNISEKENLSKQQLYSHLPPISKTIQVRRTGHAGHC